MNEQQKPMTVAELIAHLQTFPPDAGVIYQQYSDCSPMRAELIGLERAIPKDHYIMRFYENQHASLTPDEQARVQTFVAFPGN